MIGFPAIVSAGSLMPVVVRKIIVPPTPQVVVIDSMQAVLDAYGSPSVHREIGEALARDLYATMNRKGFARLFFERNPNFIREQKWQMDKLKEMMTPTYWAAPGPRSRAFPMA